MRALSCAAELAAAAHQIISKASRRGILDAKPFRGSLGTYADWPSLLESVGIVEPEYSGLLSIYQQIADGVEGDQILEEGFNLLASSSKQGPLVHCTTSSHCDFTNGEQAMAILGTTAFELPELIQQRGKTTYPLTLSHGHAPLPHMMISIFSRVCRRPGKDKTYCVRYWNHFVDFRSTETGTLV